MKGEFNMTENEEKRLQNLREKMANMKRQEQSLIARAKEKERKARTHRLIQNGALAEKYLDCEKMEPAEFEKKLKGIVNALNAVKNG